MSMYDVVLKNIDVFNNVFSKYGVFISDIDKKSVIFFKLNLKIISYKSVMRYVSKMMDVPIEEVTMDLTVGEYKKMILDVLVNEVEYLLDIYKFRMMKVYVKNIDDIYYIGVTFNEEVFNKFFDYSTDYEFDENNKDEVEYFFEKYLKQSSFYKLFISRVNSVVSMLSNDIEKVSEYIMTYL